MPHTFKGVGFVIRPLVVVDPMSISHASTTGSHGTIQPQLAYCLADDPL